MSVHISSLVYRSRLGGATRKAVALKLADCADDGGGNIWPSVPRVARETECSERQVQRILADLRRCGLLLIERIGGKGPGSTNRYRFDMTVLGAMAAGNAEIGTGADGKIAVVDATIKGDMASPLSPYKGDMASPLSPYKGDMASPFEAGKGDTQSSKGDTVSPDPSLPVQSLPSLPLEQDAADAGEGEGSASRFSQEDLQLLAAIPDERRKLAEDVLAGGQHPAIARHLLLPCLTTLGVKPGADAATWLADWLDAAAEARVSEAALRAAVKTIRRERKRDLPWPSDLPKLLAEAAARILITHQPHSPGWAAWIFADKRDKAKAGYARTAERGRWTYATAAPWPAPSAEVEQVSDASWLVPAATPEHAAWLAAWRLEGRDGAVRAQSADVAGRTITVPSRWPEPAKSAEVAA